MSKVSYVDFRTIKQSVTIEQVLERYDLLDRFQHSQNGEALSGPCPIHKGENPTQFRVSLTKNCWNCFSDQCKAHGNVLDLVSKLENCSIYEAAQKCIDWFNLDEEAVSSVSKEESTSIREPRVNPAAPLRIETKQNASPLPENGKSNPPLKFRLEKLEREHPYLVTTRGLTLETIIDFGLGYFTGERGVMKDHVVIPINNIDGQVVAYAGRWPGEPPEGTGKYKFPAGFRKSLELFNLDRAIKENREKPLVIVEGFFGAIHLHQLGHRKVVALMGSSMSSAQEELLRKHIASETKVLVMLDEDDAGHAGRADIAARLAPFMFTKTHTFAEAGRQPEDLTVEEARQLFGGAQEV